LTQNVVFLMLLHYLSSDLTSELLFYCDFEDTNYTCPFDETTNDVFDWRLRTVIMHFFVILVRKYLPFCSIKCIYVACFDVRYDFYKTKKVVRFIFTSSCLYGDSSLIYIICVCWCI